MANTNPSMFMNLPIPVVGEDPGPDWATNYDSCLTIIDAHNHSAGYGTPVNTDGININADLTFNNFNLTSARSLRMAINGSAISQPADLAALYVTGVDLWYIDGSGNQIRMTQGGSPAGGAGTITGLPSGTASVAYNATSKTYIFQSSTATSADLDAGSLLMRNSTASSFALTLAAPAAMAADYTITLPALPIDDSATNLMSMTHAGAITAGIRVDNSTLQLVASVLSIKAGGITNSYLAGDSVSTPQIVNGAVTTAKLDTSAVTNVKIASGSVDQRTLAAINQGTSTDSGVYTATNTTYSQISGASTVVVGVSRPVLLTLQGATGNTNESYVQSGAGQVEIAFFKDSAQISPSFVITSAAGFWTPSLNWIYLGAVSGSHTYQAAIKTSTGNFTVSNVAFIATEM